MENIIIAILITVVVGIPCSILAAYIYDNWFRNNTIEPAYMFNNDKKQVNTIYHISQREVNRKIGYKIFYILFNLYLIWASLYMPLIIKAGILAGDTLDLTNSNLLHILNWLGFNIEVLKVDLETIIWHCFVVSILLLVPSISFQSKVSSIFINIKNKFYDINNKDWDKYRAYGLLIFVTFILIINIFLITLFSLLHSIIFGIFIIGIIIAKANE